MISSIREKAERHRLDVLASYAILNTLPEEEYDALTQLAAQICQTPISLISLLDNEYAWFKSTHGWPLRQTLRQQAFCNYVLQNPDDLLVVDDTRQDYRFAENPLTTGSTQILFYAGAPLVSPEGEVLGTLCVMDRIPRHLTAEQKKSLATIARQVVNLLELRRTRARLDEAEQKLRDSSRNLPDEHRVLQAVVDTAPAGLVLWDPIRDAAGRIVDFQYVLTNPVNAALTGLTVGQLTGNTLATLFPGVAKSSLFDRLVNVAETGIAQRFQEYHQHDGIDLWGDFTVTPVGKQVLFSVLDITRLKEAEARLRRDNQALEEQVAERAAEVGRLAVLQKAILQYAGIGIVATNPEGVIQSVNPALETLLGYGEHELRDCHISQLLTNAVPAGLPAGSESLPAYLAGQTSGQVEMLLWHRNGTPVTVLLTVSQLRGENDSLLGYVAMVTDVTAVKAVERRLERAHRRLQLATRAAGQGVWDYNALRRELNWDDRVLELFGMSRSEFRGRLRDFLSRVDENSQEAFRQATQQKLPALHLSMRVPHPDSHLRYLKCSAQFIYGASGELVRSIGIVWDVTEQKMAEDALRESEERFRQIAENVDQAIWIHNARPFQLLYRNPLLERLWGLNEVEPGSLQAIVSRVVPADRPLVLQSLRAYRSGQPVTMECRIQMSDGSQRWLHSRTFVVPDKTGRPERYIGLTTDITHQKQTELNLQAAVQQEQELNRLKSQFVSTASHQFRTPLATIQTSVDLISLYADRVDKSTQVPLQKHLRIIQREIEKFSDLLSDILVLGRIEAGRLPFNPHPMDILQVCQELLETHFTRRSDGRQVVLYVFGTPRQVMLDNHLFAHALLNLLANAFKFSTGNPQLWIQFRESFLEVSVVDDGIGIPADDLPYLFGTFFRAGNASSVAGTGLGLAIARQFIQLHSGTLDVSSAVNKGSRFTISLPLC